MKCVIAIRTFPEGWSEVKEVEDTERNIFLYPGNLDLTKCLWGHGTFEE